MRGKHESKTAYPHNTTSNSTSPLNLLLFSPLSSKNPFINNVYTISTAETDQLEFAVVADIHLLREIDDSNIKGYDDNFEAFLASKTGGYTALLSLGDLVDEQEPVIAEVTSFISRFAKYCSNRFITTIGNPDIYERSNFARILEENKVSLVLTAHLHKGNVIYKYK